jgi:flavin-dependent dehydrogenase
MTYPYDVTIIGGGPAGSTLGSLLRKHDPSIRVLILERERFPREHVGESQLPPIGRVLEEMGCWEKVEAAGFPIKIGATFRWGRTPDLWDFEFVTTSEVEGVTRPGTFEGVRRRTAFQVDRALYDQILLDHAAELGCEVRQETRVTEVLREGDRVIGLRMDDPASSLVTSSLYIDASGGAGTLRRAMGVEVDAPSQLRNIAVWDYWEDAEWAVEIGVGGTRVQVLSLDYGWVWFIPLGPTKASVGLVVPADYYKTSGEAPEALYRRALSEEPRVRYLLRNASREETLRATKDWSYVSQRIVGENWALVGESAGFADPILAAGMTLAQLGARELAYTILEARRGQHETDWLFRTYEETQQRRIRQHIRFANYWYTANGCFTDLKEFTREIAREEGLDLDAENAFRWLGTGGFATDNLINPSVGVYSLDSIKRITDRMGEGQSSWEINRFNRFDLALEGAERRDVAGYHDGHVVKCPCYVRDGRVLPEMGVYNVVVQAIRKDGRAESLVHNLGSFFTRVGADPNTMVDHALQALEAMVVEGWVRGSLDSKGQRIHRETPTETPITHRNRDAVPS